MKMDLSTLLDLRINTARDILNRCPEDFHKAKSHFEGQLEAYLEVKALLGVDDVKVEVLCG